MVYGKIVTNHGILVCKLVLMAIIHQMHIKNHFGEDMVETVAMMEDQDTNLIAVFASGFLLYYLLSWLFVVAHINVGVMDILAKKLPDRTYSPSGEGNLQRI